MENDTVQRQVDRADYYAIRGGRVELIKVKGKGRVGRGERVASFPVSQLTDENWQSIDSLTKILENGKEVEDE